ncbi:DUF2380 domain-containing protein [Halodurantibacterium flavum]|uniref:DUF2380 domain-containing protein n=1 Tax=Halodurantibacterium flavum TaxID=1382802 RepID=A0ABW4S9U6_9RHOB
MPVHVLRHNFQRPKACAALIALLLALPGAAPAQERPAQARPAQERLAVAEFAFRDTSGELRDQRAEHAERLAAFAATLRAGTGAVPLDCDLPCSPADPGPAALTRAAEAAGADLLLIGEFHKVSTLIGWIRIAVLELPGGGTRCERLLSYRGDTDEAWQRAAEFTLRDLGRYCLDPPG